MKIRSMLACGALALAVAGGSVATAGAASATPRPVPRATGSVALASPTQYEVFNVVAGPGRYHGWVDYANFAYKVGPRVHTNVWNMGNANALTFTVGTTPYAHTMKVTTVTPLSTHSTQFTGTGYYNPDPVGYAWTISGTVNWNQVSFIITYTGSANPGYQVTATGTINPNGSVTGTATDTARQALSFTMPPGAAFQVLRYTTLVTSASVYAHHNASFVYAIPWRMPFAGLRVAVKVHDGGPGFTYDTYASGVIWGRHHVLFKNYPITSGDIFVK